MSVLANGGTTVRDYMAVILLQHAFVDLLLRR
jgi:hypothetical protein